MRSVPESVNQVGWLTRQSEEVNRARFDRPDTGFDATFTSQEHHRGPSPGEPGLQLESAGIAEAHIEYYASFRMQFTVRQQRCR